VWGAGLTFALFELPHFIMERKMMLTIKRCAERGRLLASARRARDQNSKLATHSYDAAKSTTL
jgi:hypothetical protein